MEFFQKKWVSIVLCVVMVVAAIGITQNKRHQNEYHPESEAIAENWGEENYTGYTQYISDSGFLSDGTIQEISKYNASFDYSYGSICGVAVVDHLSEQTISQEAIAQSEALQLGDCDCLLVMYPDAEDWYFAYGDTFSYYVDQELEILIKGSMNEAAANPEEILPELFEELSDWYEDHYPVSQDSDDGVKYASSLEHGSFLIVLLVLIVMIIVFSSLARAGRRFIWGWGPTIFVGRRHRPFRTGPYFHHNPGPGTRNTGPRPSGRSGGFGRSSRGGGFGDRGGGFGGGSRGGGFGGRK